MRYTTRIIVPPRVRRSGAPGAGGAGPRPQAIGVRKSLGFGDPLGLAGPAHLALAAVHPDFAPFFAQHSARELTATGRSLAETLATASRAVGAARFRQPWGADADLLRTPQDVDDAAAAGFTYFTLDLSGHTRDDAHELPADELAALTERMVVDGELSADWASPYLDREITLGDGEPLRLTAEPLQRAAVRLGRAIHHGARMYETAARANRGRPFEVEVSLDGAEVPTSVVEHLYLGLELEARGVRLTSLALPLGGGDPAAFETALRVHVAVASFCGPYKLSFRGERYDSALVPAVGRCCGDLLHFKTSLESLLEAVRLSWSMEPERAREALGEVRPPDDADLASPGQAWQEEAVRAASTTVGWKFLQEIVAQHPDMYQELLNVRFGRLIQALNAG